jgi:hypothetical protein
MAGISDFIADYVDWCEQKPDGPGRYSVEFTLVTNQPDYACECSGHGENVACFASGTLEFSADPAPEPRSEKAAKNGGKKPAKLEQPRWARFVGAGKQYFSDRRYSGPGSKKGQPSHPFDAKRTETIGLRIDTLLGDDPCVSVGITLADWGDYEYGFHPEYRAGVLYGFSNAIGYNVPAALYSLTLTRRFQPAPPTTP